jgi:hypothetical protein
MKRALLFAMLLVAGRSQASAQDHSELMTGGLLNCRAWNVMPETSKAIYLSGGLELLTIALAEIFPGPEGEKRLAQYLPAHGTRDEIQKALTQPCADPANGFIPLANMLTVVALRANGGKPAEIEDRLADMRKAWSAVLSTPAKEPPK